MILWCCQCKQGVEARLTDGTEIYPHRGDLAALPFWKCDTCKNYVGCHHKTGTPTKPLGNIPNDEIRNARQHIHRLIDGVWKSGEFARQRIYARLSWALGYSYHTGEIKSVEDARVVYSAAVKVINELRIAERNALPETHPYVKTFQASITPYGAKWRVIWRGFDTKKQSEIFESKADAQKLAQKLRRKCKYLTDEERKDPEFATHEAFWFELFIKETRNNQHGNKHLKKGKL